MPGVAAEIWTNIFQICLERFRNTRRKVVLVKEGEEAETYSAHREYENFLQCARKHVRMGAHGDMGIGSES